ncbi:MAG: hypothetical protein HFJ20_04750 [Clostridia bacterium]|jgi:hypothetical protein|nr:hypothetical protein [Clostridia bacterium]
MEKLLQLAKQCLGIMETATLKDKEIKLLIKSGIEDLKRQSIKASVDTENDLIKFSIIMFVKANFGNVDIKEKELAQRTYSLLCNNLSLSSEFKVVDSNA